MGLSCEAGSLSHCCNPQRFFQSEILRLYIPTLELWVVRSVRSPVVLPSLSACKWGTMQSPSCRLAESPLQPDCPPPPLLLVWMNVSSLSPWLLDFHTVRFFGTYGCFLFLNLLSSFWLCEEAWCIYLRLHLWKFVPFGSIYPAFSKHKSGFCLSKLRFFFSFFLFFRSTCETLLFLLFVLSFSV